jgi:hypothetical protein
MLHQTNPTTESFQLPCLLVQDLLVSLEAPANSFKKLKIKNTFNITYIIELESMIFPRRTIKVEMYQVIR